MVRTQVQLTPQQAAALRERAASEKVSVSELIRRSVDALLAHNQPDGRVERKQRASAAIGFLKDGPVDLAERHDEYLADAYVD